MHTFFINTAGDKLFDAKKVIDFMFSSLKKSNKLISYIRNLDELSACALEISKLIDKDKNIIEEFNIIIYADVVGYSEEAVVFEDATLLLINNRFLAKLAEKGHKARSIQIIWGEHFDFQDITINQSNIQTRVCEKLWSALELPNEIYIHDLVNKVKQMDCMTSNEILANLGNGFVEILDDKTRNSEIISAVQENFLQLLAMNIENTAQECHAAKIFYTSLHEMLEQQSTKYTCNRNRQSIIHFCFQNRTIFEVSRSSYQLYLYVFACALQGKLGSLIPEVNWEKLIHIFEQRKNVLSNEFTHVQDIRENFPHLKFETLGGESFDANYDDIDIISLKEVVPEFRNEVKLNASLFMLFQDLDKTSNLVFKDLEKKERNNTATLQSFINQVTFEFNESKLKFFTPENVRKPYRDETKPIKEIKQTESKITASLNQTEEWIASQDNLSLFELDFITKIMNAKNQVKYLTKCMEKGYLILVTFLFVLLLFLVPHLLLQFEDLNATNVFIAFLSAAKVSVIFWLAYIFFLVGYKLKVIKVLKELRREFNIVQEKKESYAKAFKKRLTHYIPRCIILHTYYLDLQKQVDKVELLNKLISYHKDSLDDFRNYIEQLARNFDIGNLQNHTVSEQSVLLDLEWAQHDKAALTKIYSIFPDVESIMSVLEGGDTVWNH